MNLEIDRYLETLNAYHARHYVEVIGEMVVAKAMGKTSEVAALRSRLERIVAETMGIAEVMGASLMLRQAAGVYIDEYGAALQADLREMVAFKESHMLANVTFQEALDDMVTRTPVFLRNAAMRTAQRISQLYSEGRVIAFARAAEQAVTDRVQALLAQAMREGTSEGEVGTLIKWGVDRVRKETEAWTEGYSRMVFRTNLNTAVTAGRFRQSQDPDVKAAVPAFRFDAVGDVDTRHNHGAADGRVMKVDNLAWNRIAPPLGYNCRCQVSFVTKPMLRRMGRLTESGDVIEDKIPSTAFPDPGFRHAGRPDLFIVQ